MSQTSSPRIGGLLLRLLCSFVLAFSLIGICGGSIGTAVTGSPSLLTAQISKQDAARKVCDALKSQFETEYNATAVPADVYLDALSANWLEDAMKQQVTDSYQNPANKTVPDFSALEQSITDYFERYAAENHCEKDSTYDTKLAQTIQNAEHTIQDALDVYQLDTLKNAGLWQKLIGRTHKPLMLLTVGCGILAVLAIGALLLLRSTPCYWIGTGTFAGGVLLAAPMLWVMGSNYISRFSLKEPAVYAVFTGTMTQLAHLVLLIGLLLTAAGLVLLTGSILRSRRSQPDTASA